VLSLGGIVVWESVRVGGYELDEAIVRYVARTSEPVDRPGDGRGGEDRGRLGLAAAEELETTSPGATGHRAAAADVRRLGRGSERDRAAARDDRRRPVRRTLEATPPELAADVASRGIVVAGGGALLRGIERRLGAETGLPSSLPTRRSSASCSEPAPASRRAR
jgi:rod shape-determining protein MreB